MYYMLNLRLYVSKLFQILVKTEFLLYFKCHFAWKYG